MSNQTVEPFESDEIDEYIKYNREYRFNINKIRYVISSTLTVDFLEKKLQPSPPAKHIPI